MPVPRSALIVLALVAGLEGRPAAAANPLAAYDVDPATVSVSGLSSGGFMAAQLGVAYSATFKAGFGVFAGGPYDCARNQNYTACMYNQTPAISTPVANMRSWSGNQIDATGNLANRKIFIWVGSSDTTVGPNPANQLKAQLANFDSSGNVSSIVTSGAAHTFPTDFSGSGDNSCSSAASPYVSNCSYDGAGAVLSWIYGTLGARNAGTLGGTIVAFDQTAFLSGNGMDTTGYLYVPAACAAGGSTVCKLHVALHGCLQSHNNISMTFINNTGYNKWADTNNIIVLYPQAIPDNTSHATWDSGSLPNPNGCWDWIGWYGSSADQKGGAQMAALVAMVNKITSGFGGGAVPPAPTGLAATGTTSTSVSLSWTAAPGATSYDLYRNNTRVASGINATSTTDGGLTASTTYTYAVSGVNSTGEGAKSASVNATTAASGGGTVPPAPTGLVVTGTTSSTISLSWTAAAGATTYDLYRNNTRVASGLSGTSATDSGLSASTTYTYAVSGVNSTGEGAKSASANGTTASGFVKTCTNASNYAHLLAGRAHDYFGYALANGSNQNMGLDNIFYTNVLEQTSPGYYIINNGVCP